MTLRGTVVRMSASKPLVTHMSFLCGKCGSKVDCAFVDGLYAPPARCTGEGCRSKTFLPHRASAACVDWQKVRGCSRDGYATPLLAIWPARLPGVPALQGPSSHCMLVAGCCCMHACAPTQPR